MKHRKTIFLSYRRDDNPGYVRQLQEDLQRTFGNDSVFRDVEDIAGGASWKQVLEDSLADSAALIVIIGSRWEQIWNERKDSSSDYIVYELNYARDRGIPIIPVTVDGAKLSWGIELGPLSWLMDKQFYDLSDKQGRWSTDVDGLTALLERLPGITAARAIDTTNTVSRKKWVWIAAAVLLVGAGILAYINYDPVKKAVVVQNKDPVKELVAEVAKDPIDKEPVIKETVKEKISVVSQEPVTNGESDAMYPDVSGTWVANDGTQYQFGPVTEGRFTVVYGESEGEGRYIPRMPRKFSVELEGIGKGEYSYSNDNNKIIGGFTPSGTNQTEYQTFYREE